MPTVLNEQVEGHGADYFRHRRFSCCLVVLIVLTIVTGSFARAAADDKGVEPISTPYFLKSYPTAENIQRIDARRTHIQSNEAIPSTHYQAITSWQSSQITILKIKIIRVNVIERRVGGRLWRVFIEILEADDAQLQGAQMIVSSRSDLSAVELERGNLSYIITSEHASPWNMDGQSPFGSDEFIAEAYVRSPNDVIRRFVLYNPDA
jgi:hypothetical protein